MRDLMRAVVQFACEVTIYASERILETLAAERPLHDEPLPDDFVPDELWVDDFLLELYRKPPGTPL
jgi:hypothetical protein